MGTSQNGYQDRAIKAIGWELSVVEPCFEKMDIGQMGRLCLAPYPGEHARLNIECDNKTVPANAFGQMARSGARDQPASTTTTPGESPSVSTMNLARMDFVNGLSSSTSQGTQTRHGRL